jgi:hypothetical protein
VKKNIGTSDRILRFAIAVALFAYAWWQSSWIALGLGLFTLYESLAGWCILYQMIGKNSCPVQYKKKK